MAKKWVKTIHKNVVFEDEIFTIPRLISAFERNNISVIKQFLERGYDPNTHMSNYVTGLHIAATQNYYNLAKILIVHPNIQINCQDTDGKTPLSLAAKFNNLAVLRLLIEFKADLEISDKNGYTPLHYAVLWKNLEIVETLLEYGANVHAENTFGKTPLYLACLENPSFEIIKVLVYYGADINLANGITLPILLEMALICKSYLDENIIKLLLLLGAEINIQSIHTRKTALHIAAITGHVPLAKILCTSGANVEMRDAQLRTPRDIALQQENFAIVVYLDRFTNRMNSNLKSLESKQQKPAKPKKKKGETMYFSVYKS